MRCFAFAAQSAFTTSARTAIFCLSLILGYEVAHAQELVAAPDAGFDFIDAARFNSGGVLSISTPSQPGFDTPRDFMPIIEKRAGDQGQLHRIRIAAFAEIPSLIGTEGPVPMDLAELRSNLVLNLHYFASHSAMIASPLTGEKIVSLSVSQSQMRRLSPVTSSQGTVNNNVYELTFDLPSSSPAIEVADEQVYAIGANFSLIDENGQPKISTLMVRILAANEINDTSSSTYFSSRTSSNSSPSLGLLEQATNGRAVNVAIAAEFVKPAPVAPPSLALGISGSVLVVSFRTEVSSPERWSLYITTDFNNWTKLSDDYRSIDGGIASWRIPLSSLPPESGFFKVMYE